MLLLLRLPLRPPLRLPRRLPLQRHLSTHPPTTEYRRVPNQSDLLLHISTPATATAKTPTILRLPFTTPPPPSPDSAIIITPTHAYLDETPIYPTTLHYTILALLETRRLYPASSTGILASGYDAGIALSAALTAGRRVVAAVAVYDPVVELLAEGAVGWDPRVRRWVEDSTAPFERALVFGEDPTLYWADPFASPLLFFVESGLRFPDPHQRATASRLDGVVEMIPQIPRRRRKWVQPILEVDEIVAKMRAEARGEREEVMPRIVMTLGTGEQARSQALFVDAARKALLPPEQMLMPDTLEIKRPARGVNHGDRDVGVLREGVGADALGGVLLRMLKGGEVGDVLERGRAAGVLERRGGGNVDEILMDEDELSAEFAGSAAAQGEPEETEVIDGELVRKAPVTGYPNPADAMRIAMAAIEEGLELPEPEESKKAEPERKRPAKGGLREDAEFQRQLEKRKAGGQWLSDEEFKTLVARRMALRMAALQKEKQAKEAEKEAAKAALKSQTTASPQPPTAAPTPPAPKPSRPYAPNLAGNPPSPAVWNKPVAAAAAAPRTQAAPKRSPWGAGF